MRREIIKNYNIENKIVLLKGNFKNMIKVRWTLDEAVVLLNLYFCKGGSKNISDKDLEELTNLYKNRAKRLRIIFDEKFRNCSGLRMQLGCIQYVVTNGQEGMSNCSRVFYDAYDLYKKEPEKFQQMLDNVYDKYF